MSIIGIVDSLWRYPVKSMRGEELDYAVILFSGVYGDRLFAFHSSTSPAGFPYLTGREKGEMLRFRPRFRHPDKALEPSNLSAAMAIGSGVTPVTANPDDLGVDVESPSGEIFAIDDPKLLEVLGDGLRDGPTLSLLRSDRAMTDCRPVSLFSIQTADQLADELGVAVDKRRFRASIYVDLTSQKGFGEDEFVGRSLRIGSQVVVAILQRDQRCKMITLDPDTGEANPDVLRNVVQTHDAKAGVYGAVLVEGIVRKGDAVEVLDP